MLLLRIVLLIFALALAAYGGYAMLAAELILPTLSGVENGRFVQLGGLTALFGGATVLGLAVMLACSMFGALSRHPVREMQWQDASGIALRFAFAAFTVALISAVMGWDNIYSGFLAASEPVDVYLHPSAIE